MKNIVPEKDLRNILLKVSKPGRYVGGEYIPRSINTDEVLRVALSFPDMYEIGMSNLAIRILYALLNSLDGVACERVFAPAPDFEEQLRTHSLPIYTLETGSFLHDFDIIGFSVGYELTFTNILQILSLAAIPLRSAERDNNDPIVIAGGPSITNPVPFADFCDALFIGEAETVVKEVFADLAMLKRRGAHRDDLLERMREEPSFWMSDKKEGVRAMCKTLGSLEQYLRFFPVPNIKTVQDHGVIEIMRGCPNSCRFCHASYIYRPLREKDIATIFREAEAWIGKLGYSEITLSSLSSGDYSRIRNLIELLNTRFDTQKVSFAFPSLRINTFILPLLEELSAVRKSGLTFAVETPLLEWQQQINKEVDTERIVEILSHAKQLGWRVAKFYFMIGLPIKAPQGEADAIVDLLHSIRRRTKIQLNVNLGTFIPKPHTPFQWDSQLSLEASHERLRYIKSRLQGKAFKVSYHSPFLSFLEGFITRGDRRAGEIVEAAFHNGARFDAWEEYLNRDAWEKAFAGADWDVFESTYRERGYDELLPWQNVDTGVSAQFLRRERERSAIAEVTGPCDDPCPHHCGVCRDGIRVQRSNGGEQEELTPSKESDESSAIRVLASYRKRGKAVFLSHLNMVTIFQRAFRRAGIELAFTRGFNPKPKMEFAHPLSLGIASEQEIASFECLAGTENECIVSELADRLNRVLPPGIEVIESKIIGRNESRGGGKTEKKRSLMSLYGGSVYAVFSEQGKEYREQLEQFIRKGEIEARDCEVISPAPQALETAYENTVTVFVKNSGKKTSNIMHVLSSFLGVGKEQVFDFFSLVRLQTRARSGDGEFSDYFALFSD
jgi:radical SAM-linked protein